MWIKSCFVLDGILRLVVCVCVRENTHSRILFASMLCRFRTPIKTSIWFWYNFIQSELSRRQIHANISSLSHSSLLNRPIRGKDSIFLPCCREMCACNSGRVINTHNERNCTELKKQKLKTRPRQGRHGQKDGGKGKAARMGIGLGETKCRNWEQSLCSVYSWTIAIKLQSSVHFTELLRKFNCTLGSAQKCKLQMQHGYQAAQQHSERNQNQIQRCSWGGFSVRVYPNDLKICCTPYTRRYNETSHITVAHAHQHNMAEMKLHPSSCEYWDCIHNLSQSVKSCARFSPNKLTTCSMATVLTRTTLKIWIILVFPFICWTVHIVLNIDEC